MNKQPSLWISVAFYLSIFIVLVVTLLIVANVIPLFVLPIVLLDGILTISIVGAVQLQQDDQLGQKNFLELMVLAFKYLPWLRERDE